MKTTIRLPFFPGFYESWLENSDTSYWAIKEELDYYYHGELGRTELTEDDLDFDYKAYEKEVCDAFVEVWKNLSPDFVKSVEFEELWRPRYYNFETDRIYAKIEMEDDWKEKMRAFMDANWFELSKRIDDDWSDRDGFISFMNNRIDGWIGALFVEEDARYIGVMLGYMMEFEDKDIFEHLCEATLQDICAESYVYVIKDREKE
jgi:hypothetical protein